MKILVLAGTAEARDLSQRLAELGYNVEASLAGATRQPASLGVPTRMGGFGGVSGLQKYILMQGIDVLIDATHPFAHRMTANAAAVDVTYHAILQRPAWRATQGDHWIEIDEPKQAASYVKPGDIVFLATGRQTITEFASLDHAYTYARVIDPPLNAYPFQGEFLCGTPPFSVEAEIALFERLKINWLIVKNAGGQNSISKLIAARTLHIPVLMLKRPAVPDARIMQSVDDVIEWVKTLG